MKIGQFFRTCENESEWGPASLSDIVFECDVVSEDGKTISGKMEREQKIAHGWSSGGCYCNNITSWVTVEGPARMLP
jgi:hypothetical protein